MHAMPVEMQRRPRLWGRHVCENGYLPATLTMVGLLAVFFNPIVRHDATFSTVGVVQRSSNPWATLDPAGYVGYPVHGYQGAYVHPARVFLDRSLKRDGQIPLWNPLALGGHPYLATEATGVAYPPKMALSLLFGPTWVHDLFLVGHLLVAGLAMFALMKGFGAGVAGALLRRLVGVQLVRIRLDHA